MLFFVSHALRLSVVLCAVVASVSAQASNDDAAGKEIYITAPACDSYQCINHWHRGATHDITWLNAPSGGLKIKLVPEEGTSGLKSCEPEALLGTFLPLRTA